MIRNVVIGVGAVILLVLMFEFLVDYDNPTPAFIYGKVRTLMEDPVLIDSIGRSPKVSYHYKRHDLETDTFKYQIKMQGWRRNLVYEGVHLRDGEKDWKLIKETITIE